MWVSSSNRNRIGGIFRKQGPPCPVFWGMCDKLRSGNIPAVIAIALMLTACTPVEQLSSHSGVSGLFPTRVPCTSGPACSGTPLLLQCPAKLAGFASCAPALGSAKENGEFGTLVAGEYSGYVYTNKFGTAYTFDPLGRLTTIHPADNLPIQISYVTTPEPRSQP
jgi:hypothetical protein